MRPMVRQAHHEGKAVEPLDLILSLSKDEPSISAYSASFPRLRRPGQAKSEPQSNKRYALQFATIPDKASPFRDDANGEPLARWANSAQISFSFFGYWQVQRATRHSGCSEPHFAMNGGALMAHCQGVVSELINTR